MMMKKPVIGANIGAIPETVIHNKTGLLFNMGDSEMLSTQINTLYQNQQLISKLGENAFVHVQQLTNPEKHYKNLQKIIPSLNKND